MFESLSDRLDNAFKVFTGDNKLTELNVAQSIKEIRRALVAADVNYKIAKEFTDKVKDKALGEWLAFSIETARRCTVYIYFTVRLTLVMPYLPNHLTIVLV